jgi:hypothetical protein
MAVNAYVRFDREHKVEIEETPAEVVAAVTVLGAPRVPLVRLTRAGGKSVIVNADRIRSISEPG